MTNRFTTLILLALVLGIAVGSTANHLATEAQAAQIAGGFSVVTELFLRLIKMIIAPLVFSTLVAGIAQIGDGAAVGRIAVRTMMWFICAGVVSLSLGLAIVGLIAPGAGLDLPLPGAGTGSGVQTASPSIGAFVTHLVPESFVAAMAHNEILQIVIFAGFAGIALRAIGERGAPLAKAVDALVALMLRMTQYVMRAAPIPVFTAIAAVTTVRGATVLLTFGKFIIGFYLALAILWGVLGLMCALMIGSRAGELARRLRAPVLLAFSTASSEAAYPGTLEQLEKFGVPRRIASFVLPLGYSFNLDGSMMYCAFAVMFIAQAYGVDLTVAQQLTMLLLLMVTSKGMAGVPRASVVVVAATLPLFGLPEAGLLLILGVDQFLDMGRSATNVVGNAVAAAVVAKWDGVLESPESDLHATSDASTMAAKGAKGSHGSAT